MRIRAKSAARCALLATLAGVVSAASCTRADDRAPPASTAPATTPSAARTTTAPDLSRRDRERMVDEQIAARGVSDARVLAAMKRVPRHAFVPDELRQLAYLDRPLPIGHDQTISQPYIVAAMTELARVGPDSKVLEIGTGSGYQAAVLAEIVADVYTIEIVEPLAERAARTLEALAYTNVHVRVGDGYQGWPEHAPFDAIVVTAAPPRVPEPLKQQLAVGARLVIPVGERYQELRVITRTADGFEERVEFPVMFVPMTGRASGE